VLRGSAQHISALDIAPLCLWTTTGSGFPLSEIDGILFEG
jgi:hypothetical protein